MTRTLIDKQQRSELEEIIATDPEEVVAPSAESLFRQGPLTLDDLRDGDGCCEDERDDE